jgi:hypothetical protein
MVQAEVASGRNAGESRRKSVNGEEIESNQTGNRRSLATYS